MHKGEMEVILARHLNPRINLIVPNVSWGLGIHEVDLLVLSPSNYASEIEIKISLADLKADLKKEHGHYSNKIKKLYFAVPKELEEKALEIIPERAGLFVVDQGYTKKGWRYGGKLEPYVYLKRSPKLNPTARNLNDKEIKKLYELAAMRIWSLKETVYRLQKQKDKK
jgi:hypothetical protein